jgi:hypothetical protein
MTTESDVASDTRVVARVLDGRPRLLLVWFLQVVRWRRVRILLAHRAD